EHFGRGFGETVPVALVAFLEGEALGIRPVTQDYRILAIADRTEHIGAQHDAVVHFDGRVPVDLHAVALFAFHRITLVARSVGKGADQVRRICTAYGAAPCPRGPAATWARCCIVPFAKAWLRTAPLPTLRVLG